MPDNAATRTHLSIQYAEKKVNSSWDMLPTELHVVILKIHHQATMLFHTRGWMFMKTVCGWQRIDR
jgi:hypothetical protein